MIRCQIKFTVVLSACLVITGCSGWDAPGVNDRAAHRSSPLNRLVETEVLVNRATLTSTTGRTLRLTRYRSAHARADELVVLGHGFLRDSGHLADLAHALAAAGMTTVALDFSQTRFWDGGQVRNAIEMMTVADALGARRVVYAGFSAGALAALIAGRNDPRALGVVALDLVDAQGMGAHMASGMTRPLIGLVGEPSWCNANRNGLVVYAASRQAVVKRMVGADHCDFESPTDWLCRLVCARRAPVPAPNHAASSQDIIRTATTAVHSLLFHARPD